MQIRNTCFISPPGITMSSVKWISHKENTSCAKKKKKNTESPSHRKRHFIESSVMAFTLCSLDTFHLEEPLSIRRPSKNYPLDLIFFQSIQFTKPVNHRRYFLSLLVQEESKPWFKRFPPTATSAPRAA